jgi:glutathione S-transferase
VPAGRFTHRPRTLARSLAQVDLATHKTAGGADFYAINPKGNVPALRVDDAAASGGASGGGVAQPLPQLLNENVAVLMYLGDAAGANAAVRLTPPEGSPLRYALLNRLGFLTSELHKAFGPVFGPLEPAAKERQKEVRGCSAGRARAGSRERTRERGDRC